MIGALAGERYALAERLGSGGTSSVWRARDTKTGLDVAVKVLHLDATDSPEAVARFDREARLVAELHNRNIVELFDRGQLEGRPYLVFELVEGVDLREYLRRHTPIPVADAVAIALQVANGLAAAHSLRIVHRDLKPGNVLIDDAGRVRVADFGIARAIEEPGITQAGRVVGTGEYVSPEQALGKPVDERSDLYALGVLIYEMLAGRPPFRGAFFADVAARHVRAPVPPLAEARTDTPEPLCDLVAELLAKKPADRPDSAAAVRDRLRRLLEDLGGSGALAAASLDESFDAPAGTPPAMAGASHLDDVAPWEDVTPPSMDFPLAPHPGAVVIESSPYQVPPSARPNSGPLRWVAVAALMVAVVAASVLIVRAGNGSTATTTTAGTTTSAVKTGTFATTGTAPPPSTASVAAAALPLRGDVATFDPPPGGDNSENDDQAPNAIDGDPSTWWETETYRNSPDMSKGKGGVGLIVSPRRAGAIAAVGLQVPAPGITVTIYVAAGAAAPQALSGWTVASRATVVRKSRQRIDLHGSPTARHVLIWISGLVRAPGGGGYSARIAEVQLFGTAPAPG